ncbi:hypothetical protein HYH02_007755 [Chlamydomonas schloesseri]|uniref:Uncharacterized protein n=1 Tax=Chlamydomonas schloesseri TaxID=2026947 RepID=A0A836B4Y5_9CHLO|nr:hypothetical protein HYH02_007755 [Chlamydomonas schloesseri]|eukprot:KAG2447429.1 hypothetical protein HYH02_007755 [Chlamydomonas schloesseri]
MSVRGLLLVSPQRLHSGAEPYKRLIGVLLRETCVSLSVSNPYLSLAEPAGAILLRNGRVPERTLQRLLEPHGAELTGLVLGSETHAQWEAFKSSHHNETLKQVHEVLQRVAPDLPAAWWDRWSPDAPQSCRLPQQPLPQVQARPQQPGLAADVGAAPSDASAAARGVASPGSGAVKDGASSGGGGGGGGGAPCSMATLFLQHYLDSLGTLNTFG